MNNLDPPLDSVRNILRYIGEDPERDGLKETPDRVVSSFNELYGGYRYDDADISRMLKVFEDGEEGISTPVMVNDIEFSSMCEHHMLPFIGTAHVMYTPSNGKIVGLSKIPRLVDVFAKRLQVQERLTKQILNALVKNLECRVAAVVIEARHMCMSCRGVRQRDANMMTFAQTTDTDVDFMRRYMQMVRKG
jgi:GTP cyclohydrolase IA